MRMSRNQMNHRLDNLLTYVLVIIHLLHLQSSASRLGVDSIHYNDPQVGLTERVSLEPSRLKRSENSSSSSSSSSTPMPTSTDTTTTYAPVDNKAALGRDLVHTVSAPSQTQRAYKKAGSPTRQPPPAPKRTTTTTKRSTTTSTSETKQPANKPVAPVAPVGPVAKKEPRLPQYQARDVSLFLESHQALDVHDPRAYMTNERLGSTGRHLRHDLDRMGGPMQFAFVVRIFHEMGRRLASQMNNFVRELAPLLDTSGPNLFNIKPGKELYEKAFFRATNSKDDLDPSNETQAQYEPRPISARIGSDGDKARAFNASILNISSKLAHVVLDVVNGLEENNENNNNNTQYIKDRRSAALKVMVDAMEDGAGEFFRRVQPSDKFRVPAELAHYLASILNNIYLVVMRHERDNDRSTNRSSQEDELGLINLRPASKRASPNQPPTGGYTQMNAISDRQALVGPWNNYLFHDLGTSERVVKLFGSLLRRVPVEAKSRWVNMYMEQVKSELEKTLATFVAMQALVGQTRNEPSEVYMLRKLTTNMIKASNLTYSQLKSSEKATSTLTKKTANSDNSPEFSLNEPNRNRIPARCYLAGRRWRLIMRRAMVGMEGQDAVLNDLAERVGQVKQRSGSVNELARLCLPRLEVGLRGWSINGDPHGDLSPNDFPLKTPIEHLMESNGQDPYTSGVQLGYRIGFKIAYNDKRNATLEMERSNVVVVSGDPKAANPKGGSKEKQQQQQQKADQQVDYLARASYRHGATMGARKAFEIAVHEGYLTTLKVSLRAGLLLPAQTASKLAALKGAEFGGQAGQEAGRALVNKFLVNKDLKEEVRATLRKLGESNGLLAGTRMGELLGAQVGRAAAEEAYRRSIMRGGRITRAKYNLDEFEAGARDGLDYGLREGDRVASSSSLDPSAPRRFQFVKPTFSSRDKQGQAPPTIDHWEKDLIAPITAKAMNQLHAKRNHTIVQGTLRGTYRTAKEVKIGLKRASFKNVTYNLEVDARGYIVASGDVAYLNLAGKVNNFNVLRGSLVAADIFGDQ